MKSSDCWQLCRDIKLENIFIGADGRVKLGDFGLTMSMKQEVAISPVGTVEYMAPEVKSIYCSFDNQFWAASGHNGYPSMVLGGSKLSL